jgi:hypothetical protein
MTSDHSPVYATFTLDTQRPFLSVFEKENSNTCIYLSNLFISNRSSYKIIKQPFLSFHSDILNPNVSFITKKNDNGFVSLNPDFFFHQVLFIFKKKIPVLEPLISNIDYLQTKSLIIVLHCLSLGIFLFNIQVQILLKIVLLNVFYLWINVILKNQLNLKFLY